MEGLIRSGGGGGGGCLQQRNKAYHKILIISAFDCALPV